MAPKIDQSGRSKKDLELFLDRVYRHSNGKFYRIENIAWDGVLDLWSILHCEVKPDGDDGWEYVDSEVYARNHLNFFGWLKPGVPGLRFEELTRG